MMIVPGTSMSINFTMSQITKYQGFITDTTMRMKLTDLTFIPRAVNMKIAPITSLFITVGMIDYTTLCIRNVMIT
jgi:hypothetical protein